MDPSSYLFYAPAKMFKLFTSFILFFAFQTNFAFTNVRDDAPWFRAGGDSIRKKFVTGVINGIIDTNCEEKVNGHLIQGECLSAAECLKENGKKGNVCSLLGACCVIEKTCSETTSSKISYFVTPSVFQNDCNLKIKIYSKDVCQIRLDFNEFEIYEPTNTSRKENELMEQENAFKCYIDKFKVEKVKKKLGFDYLCGKNNGQHIYIPIERDQKELDLRFLLKNRTSEITLNPKWKIKIHQLECFDKKKHESGQILDAHTKLLTLYQNLKQKKKSYKSDYELIAPPDCLQYYPERTGTFESFNFNDGKGCYIGGLDYAICFNKNSDFCYAEYSSSLNEFQMNYNTKPLENEICHPKNEAGICLSQDYIRINEGKLSSGEYKDYYCNRDLANKHVTSKSHEPLYIKVHTDDYLAYAAKDCEEDFEHHEEIGFRINYELIHCDNK